MNAKQKWILFVGVALIVASGVFPPWTEKVSQIKRLQGTRATHVVTQYKPVGLCLIISPPQSYSEDVSYLMDTRRLLIEWFIIAIPTVALMFAVRRSGGRPSDE